MKYALFTARKHYSRMKHALLTTHTRCSRLKHALLTLQKHYSPLKHALFTTYLALSKEATNQSICYILLNKSYLQALKQ